MHQPLPVSLSLNMVCCFNGRLILKWGSLMYRVLCRWYSLCFVGAGVGRVMSLTWKLTYGLLTHQKKNTERKSKETHSQNSIENNICLCVYIYNWLWNNNLFYYLYAAKAELQKTTGYHNVSRERVRVGEGGWEWDFCEKSYPQPSTH